MNIIKFLLVNKRVFYSQCMCLRSQIPRMNITLKARDNASKFIIKIKKKNKSHQAICIELEITPRGISVNGYASCPLNCLIADK